MKNIWRILFIILCIFVINSPLYAYEPLTYEEADNYLDSITYDEVVEIIIDYDYIEHTVPKVTFPKTEYVLFETDLYIYPMDDLKIEHSNFSWTIPMESDTVYDFTEECKPSFLRQAFIFIGGLAVGAGVGILIGSTL